MDTILEIDSLEIKCPVTNAALSIAQGSVQTSDRPRPEWVRGPCPQCGSELVSNVYHVGGRGFFLVWECWASLGDNPACSYRKVM